MEIEVDIIEQRRNEDTLDFHLRDNHTGKRYYLQSCHRTDNPWLGQPNDTCFYGNLYCNEEDLGVAFLRFEGERNILFSNRENI